MNAFVAVTDKDWFDFLAAQDDIDEVNFWLPSVKSGRFRALRRGEPVLFKLKAPNNAIAGGGFFEHYTELPVSLAWDTFGIKNGAPTRQAVWDRTARLRRETPEWYEDFIIGCILLAEPFFFPEDDWIPQPRDWHRNIVRGKAYDLRQGIGRKLWEEILLRLQGMPEHDDDQLILPGGMTDPVPTRRRIGQGTFQVRVLDAYGRECAVTHERALPALEAAHIKPFSKTHEHDLRNGLLLRSDVHRLFDSGYITVTPEYRVEASRRMREDFDDGENYMRLHGGRIALPRDDALRPDPEALRWHNETRFRG